MDFASYAERAIELANLQPYDAPDDHTILTFVAEAFPHHRDLLNATDVALLRDCHRGLRGILLAASDEDAVARTNALMLQHPLCPEISGHAHPGESTASWHLHLVTDRDAPGQQLAGSMTMGLMTQLLEVGLDRRGSCHHDRCTDVFLDGSPGGTRRYCSDTCQNRANVAAYRARRRGASREQEAG